MKNKLLAFTLSEGLIAIAIVGIISALTIPNIVASYQKQSYTIGIKKAYTDLLQNLTVMQTENYRKKGLSASILNMRNAFGSTGIRTISESSGEFLRTYYKTSKDCGTDTQPCFANKYASINNNTETDFKCSKGYSILTSNGSAICIIPIRFETISKPTGGIEMVYYDHATVYIDINGPKDPNIGGRDMFTFNIYEDLTLDEINPDYIKDGTAETKRNTLYDRSCLISPIGIGCFGKILNDNWNMNY